MDTLIAVVGYAPPIILFLTACFNALTVDDKNEAYVAAFIAFLWLVFVRWVLA